MDDIQSLGVRALRLALDRRELSAREAAGAYLSAIREKDPSLRAFLTVTEARAMADADAFDRRKTLPGSERGGMKQPDPEIGMGRVSDTDPARDLSVRSPLAGIPFALKDNICTEGIRTSCASRFLEDFVPPYSAAAFERLHGGVLLGKLNMDEFAMGSSTENSFFYPTRNPADPSRVPGGSSGGCAAAVAGGLCAFALGSDTGGSIRQPASLCGCVGMKPTYGRVSRYGLIAFAPSLEQIGPLTRSVRDNAMVLSAIAGQDPRDATSLPLPAADFTAGLEAGVRGLRIGLFTGEGCAPAVRNAVSRAARTLELLGAEVLPVDFPVSDETLAAYHILSGAEASSNLARFDGIKYGRRAESCRTPEEVFVKSRTEGFGPEVKRRILLGTCVLSGENRERFYTPAQRKRRQVVQAFERLFADVDMILTPTSPTTAWRFGEAADPLAMYRADMYTVPSSLAGIPALSLPFGKDADGLPCAVQLTGPGCAEGLIYRAAFALEQEERV